LRGDDHDHDPPTTRPRPTNHPTTTRPPPDHDQPHLQRQNGQFFLFYHNPTTTFAKIFFLIGQKTIITDRGKWLKLERKLMEK